MTGTDVKSVVVETIVSSPCKKLSEPRTLHLMLNDAK